MSFDVGAVVGHLQLRKDQWNQAIKDVKADQKSLSGLVLRNSQQLKQMGRAMTIAGGAIVGAFALMVKAHAKFDHSMNESLAIMGDVSDEMRKAMADAALEMSTKTTFSAEKLGKAYFFLASAGMDAAQSIKALPVVAKFAQAGTFDLSLATDLLTDAQTALGLSSKDAVENQKNMIRISDVLVGANTLANASVKQFAESLTNKAAAALISVNKEIEEGVAILAAFADRGIKGQLAGQRLTMMMNGLFDATRRNSKAWADVGISLWDAKGQMRDFADILGDLEDHLLEMTPEMRTAELATLGFNMRTVDSIKTLLGSSEKIRENTGRLKEMGGITEEVAKKQLKSLINQLTILKNVITKAAISVGKTLGPALKNIIEDIKKTVEKVVAWIKEHPKLTEVIAKSAIAVGGLLLVLGPLAIMLPGIAIGVTLVNNSIAILTVRVALLTLKAKILTAVNYVLGTSFTALLGPIGLVAIAVGSIALAAKTVTTNMKSAKKAMSDLVAEADVFADIANNFQKLWITVRKEGGESLAQFDELMKRFGGNTDKVLRQIIRDPKFATLKALLLDIASGVKAVSLEGENLSITLPESFLKAAGASKDLTETIRKNSEAVIELNAEMVDEIKRATLNEFEYRKWAAQTLYEERKALLELEKADKQAFVLLERALAAELDTIEKDKTAKFKEGWAERGRAVTAALLKWQEEERNYLSIIAEYTDIRMQLTLKEKDYKVWQAGVWYEAEKKKLWDLYGESVKYTKAKLALDKAYATKKKEIADRTAFDQMSMIEKIGAATVIALGQSKLGAIAQAFMSTYAGAAKTIEMLGMPLAIPFVALAIATGLMQVAAIQAVNIPSAEKGAYLPSPTIIEAGHGTMGEVILPLDKAPAFMADKGGAIGGGAKIDFNFYAPLIETTGIAEEDLDDLASSLFARMEREALRRGYALNGA